MKLLRGFIAFIVGFLILYFLNQRQISQYQINRVRLETSKVTYPVKITQISDFHSNKSIDLDELVKDIKSFDPDFIAITGDIIDRNNTSLDVATDLLTRLADLNIEIFYVTGNHELDHNLYDNLVVKLRDLNIEYLDNNYKSIRANNENINVIGLSYVQTTRKSTEVEAYKKLINRIENDNLTILLRHSPAYLEDLLESKESFVLAGHTHGGQVRLPLIGSIFSSGQGFFPKLDKGIYQVKEAQVHVDSGLGNTFLPIRLLNPVQISNISILPKTD